MRRIAFATITAGAAVWLALAPVGAQTPGGQTGGTSGGTGSASSNGGQGDAGGTGQTGVLTKGNGKPAAGTPAAGSNAGGVSASPMVGAGANGNGRRDERIGAERRRHDPRDGRVQWDRVGQGALI